MQITGGKYNSRKIITPEFSNIKPTLSKIRQGIFNTLSSMINFEGKMFFDMFSGSGIMSLEALSRGFRVISFEKDRRTALAIKNIFKNIGLTAGVIAPELYFGDSIKNICKIKDKADVIFLDPPYDTDLYEKSLNVIKENDRLNKNGIIIMEHPVDKVIDTTGYEIIKIKTYGNVQISYIF